MDMDSWAEMEEQILKELNLHRMKDDAEVFSRLERYSGSEAGEAAVDYLVQELEACGAMTEYGRRKIEKAKKNGQWDNAASPSAISEEQIAAVAALLKENAQAYTNFQKMPASVKKTYTRAYFDAKTEAGRSRRLAWMMDRLEKNLKPM